MEIGQLSCELFGWNIHLHYLDPDDRKKLEGLVK